MQTPDDREFGSSSPMSLDTFTLLHLHISLVRFV